MPDNIDWDALIDNAAQKTDEQFSSEISSLSRLNDSEITMIIEESGIDKQGLAQLVETLNNTTQNNTQKAQAINDISGGVKALVSIASKFI